MVWRRLLEGQPGVELRSRGDLAANIPLLLTRLARAGATQHSICLLCLNPSLGDVLPWAQVSHDFVLTVSPLEIHLLPPSEQRVQTPDHDACNPFISVVSRLRFQRL